MGISNNSPTMSYIHASGISVVWNNETYMVQDFATNKKYIYWNADLPNQLNASNVMPNRSTKQYLVIVNDNGMSTLVPSTSDDFSISFDGNSNQAIKDRIFGLYEKNEYFGEKFVAIEQDIDGIKQIVGNNGEESDGSLVDRVSKIEQSVGEIDLSVKEVSKKYNDDKETNKLREDLNSAIIKLNSTLGTFKSELTSYFKNSEISSEEKVKIETQLGILINEKTVLDGLVDTVKLIAEKNNQTQDVIAIESAKQSLQIAHDNLYNNITNAIIDSIITPTENTIIIDSFAKYNLKINELKKTCDDIIILGLGGVITEELANINIKSDEIKLSVSKVESDFKNDMSVQKIELESQIKDVSTALGTFEETVNTTFKDGIIDESEKQLLKEKIGLVDKEKVDIDLRYNSVVQDLNLSEEVKVELTAKYNEYCNKHNELKEKINHVISDNMVNDAEKLEIDTLFKAYSNSLAHFSALMNKAIENITFNTSKAELEQAKNELQGSIDGVKESIEGIDKVLDGTFENNILDEVERENIKQNLENLSREKLDIDKTYAELYGNTYLTGQDKVNFKNSYDNYISKYNEVVKLSNDILAKEDLINNIDKANMDSAIAKHKETLALFHTQANKSIDIIATNKVNSVKNEIGENLDNLKGEIDGLDSYIDGAFKDSVLSDAEKNAIKQNLKMLETGKLNIDKQYTVVYNNASLTGTAKTELKSSYDNYVLKYNSLVTVINNILDKTGLLVEADNTAINNAFKEHNMAMSVYNEKINKAIDYITIKNVEDAKSELSSNIEELGGALSGLESTMNNAFKDGVLSESEKQSIKQHLLTVSSKKTDIDKRYVTLYSNEHLEETPKTNLTTAYNNYIKAYNSLVTVINNILEKEGLIDSVDQRNLNNAFKEHDSKLGLYTTADLNALDAIAKKKAEVESEKVDKKYADIILDPENGILSKVEHVHEQINGDGGINKRLQVAEEKITEDGITQIVKDIQYIKDIEAGVETNRQNISEIDQKAESINIKVESKVDGNSIISAINMSPESIKISSSKINITGFVTFSDLRESGTTTINGSNITTGTINGNLANITNINASNITTGTINTSRVNIKGGTTKKIVIANDNYCVYDGAETDINRKVFMGFRTNTATNVPSVMLGYNGINPTVDGAVVSGGTYTTYSHYPNNDNPEGVNQSYGALAFKYGAAHYQFSTLNMYQNGDVDLKSGASMYFRPNLRDRGNHVFAITDTSVGSRVPFQCTSSIYSNGDITTDRGLYSTYLSVQGDAGVSNKFNASKLITNRIDVYGDSNLDGNTYVSGSCTIGNTLNVRNKPIYGMGSITLDRGTIYLPQGGGNTTTDYVRIGFGIIAGVSSGNFHFLTMNASPASLYASNVRSAYSLEPNSRLSDISALEQIDAINVVSTSEGLRLSSPNNKSSVDESKVVTKVYNEKTNQEEINVDYNSAISTLWKAVQELKQENEELKEVINS